MISLFYSFFLFFIFCQVSEDKEAKKIVDSALKALAMELNRELADIQELRLIQWISCHSFIPASLLTSALIISDKIQ